ncbi:MAG: hypothetical protein ACD_11C00029G0041 [uncultured bacterium]|nr:MAG: hypothetical protein ACD_11C00029G0041 [uncultured bacterium]
MGKKNGKRGHYCVNPGICDICGRRESQKYKKIARLAIGEQVLTSSAADADDLKRFGHKPCAMRD